jgi:hypothetical protein
VPKNKVARIVVRELVKRDTASPHYIYECLGIEEKEKTKSHTKGIEESATVAKQISTEESSTPTIEVASSGQETSYTY